MTRPTKIAACNKKFESSNGELRSAENSDYTFYENEWRCTYTVRNPTQKPLLIKFSNSNILHDDSCRNFSVKIWDGMKNRSSKPFLLCTLSSSSAVLSTTGMLTLEVVSNLEFGPVQFKAEYRECEDCVKTIAVKKQQVESFESYETAKTDLALIIDNPSELPVQLDLIKLFTRNTTNCVTDYIQIRNGARYNSPLINVYCGSVTPDPVITTSRKFSVFFHTETPNGTSGFSARLKSFGANKRNIFKSEDSETDALVHKLSMDKELFPRPVMLGSSQNGNVKTENPHTTVLAVVGATLFAVVLVAFILGILIRKRQISRRTEATINNCKSMNRYGTVQNPLNTLDLTIPCAENGEINVIFNENYFNPSLEASEGNIPCVVTTVEAVDCNTPSIITNADGGKVVWPEDYTTTTPESPNKDYAIEEGNQYSFTLTSQNSPKTNRISDGTNDVTLDNNQNGNTTFEDDSQFHATNNPDDSFDGAKLMINGIPK